MRSTDNCKRFNGIRLRIVALKFVTPAAVLAFLVMMLRFSGYAKAQYKAIPNYTGINAGLQFRNDINNHLSGQTPIAPRLVSMPFAQLPAEQDGWLFWCRDCRVSTPCQGGGSGAVATGEGGVWTCGGQTPLVSNFNANSNRIINLAPNTTNGDALSQGQSRLNDLAAPNASYSLNGQRLTSVGTDTTNGDVLSRGQSTLNSLGAATSNYAMGGNTLTGMAAASASGQPIIYGQSGAQLAAASTTGQPLVYAQKNAQVTTYTPAAYLANSATNSISGTTTSISLSKPAGISNGNAELLICNTSNQPGIDASWTLWRHDTGSFRDLWTLKHIVSSDPSSYTITWSPNAGGGNGCAIVGLANSSGFDSITGQYCGSGQCTASAPVSTYGNELVLVVGSDGNNFAFPSLIAPTYAAKAADFFGGNIGTTAWTYNTTPVPATLDTSWTTQQIVQQMTILGAPYQSAPVLQNQSGATVASLNATNVSAPNTISGFSVAKV